MKIRSIHPISLPDQNLLANGTYELDDKLAQDLIDGGLVVVDDGQPLQPMTTFLVDLSENPAATGPQTPIKPAKPATPPKSSKGTDLGALKIDKEIIKALVAGGVDTIAKAQEYFAKNSSFEPLGIGEVSGKAISDALAALQAS